MSAQTNPPADKQRSIAAVAARLFWMAFGNFILMICTAHFFTSQVKYGRTTDVIFWTTVIALIVVRFIDIKFFDGLTATGAPASLKQWRRYAVVLVLIAAAIWAVAHVFKS